ncbi:formyltransferase family protein [bacterium]|nr:formyltransferase family protein [bacterium]
MDYGALGMIVFAYDWRHKKTEEFLFRCFHHGFPVDAVIAAPRIDLNRPERKHRYHLRQIGIIHPKEICAAKKIPYYACPHNESENLVAELNPELGLISGALMLHQDIINKFRKGIVNFHPGLIPELRGCDTPYWAITDKVPLGVTSHFIDTRVDAGRIIKRQVLGVYPDDSLVDISLRLYEGQLEIFEETMLAAISDPLESFRRIPKDAKPSYPVFPQERESEIPGMLADYLG